MNHLIQSIQKTISLNNNSELSILISNNLKTIHIFQELYSKIFFKLIEYQNPKFLETALQAGLKPNEHLIDGVPLIQRLIAYKLNANIQKPNVIETCNILLKYNADIDTISSAHNNTLIHNIIHHTNEDTHHYSIQLLKFFLPLLKDPLKKNKYKESPIDIVNLLKISDIKRTDIKNILLLYEYLKEK